jgi:murein endopeptidase
MRLSRNRIWGHPVLLKYIKHLATEAQKHDGWPGLMVGDMTQPMGGPMLTGHASHQIGLDVDIWLKPMPAKTLGPEERETVQPVSMLAPDAKSVNPAVWSPKHFKLIKRAASDKRVARIFVHPAIKKALCEAVGIEVNYTKPDSQAKKAKKNAKTKNGADKEDAGKKSARDKKNSEDKKASAANGVPMGPAHEKAKAEEAAKAEADAKKQMLSVPLPARKFIVNTADRKWLAKVRPYWGHHYHFHVRLSCPAGMRGCVNQPPHPSGDGCGKELVGWLKRVKPHKPKADPFPSMTTAKKPSAHSYKRKRLTRIYELPVACARLVGLDPKTLAKYVPKGFGTLIPMPESKPEGQRNTAALLAAAEAEAKAKAEAEAKAKAEAEAKAQAASKPKPPLPVSARDAKEKHVKAKYSHTAKRKRSKSAKTRRN